MSSIIFQKLRKAPHRVYRERVTKRIFALADMDWSRWKLGITPIAPTGNRANTWRARHRDHVGVRRTTIFHSDDTTTPSVYEIAIQPHSAAPKHPVSFFVTTGFQGRRWDHAIFPENVHKQVDQVLERGCKLYIRRAPLKTDGEKTVKDSVKEMRTLLSRTYDYAWRTRYDATVRTRGRRHLVRSRKVISDKNWAYPSPWSNCNCDQL